MAYEGLVFGAEVEQDAGKVGFAFDVLLTLLAFDFVERRLGDINITCLDQLWHLTIKEGQKQRADVCAVDVRIGHDNNRVIACFAQIKFIGTDSGSDGGDHGADFLVGQHLV